VQASQVSWLEQKQVESVLMRRDRDRLHHLNLTQRQEKVELLADNDSLQARLQIANDMLVMH